MTNKERWELEDKIKNSPTPDWLAIPISLVIIIGLIYGLSTALIHTAYVGNEEHTYIGLDFTDNDD